MDHLLKAHRMLRKNLADVLLKTSYEDLITIPDGFNNNMYWNIAHCVATQQLLIYYLSGNPFRIDKYWIEKYKKGTLPNLDVTEQEMEDLHYLLTETSKIMANDYRDDFFTDYSPYSTSMGMDLKNIEDAILYNNIHESLHLGYISAQKRALIGERD
ncbi:DinB family protein [Elizabethkingia sp. JS20170427COW]|uniref:DinB family protein n=1 Tax=Elizabethkingia sp. JS20170427COW TaxID=2583851 RepID=UPI001110621C|nr:DinB family protein [Elizabethkingia sp. JS20170427COW]QCX53929.1 DinB family protein [Elizabethkingia sp. JS20170427COW]